MGLKIVKDYSIVCHFEARHEKETESLAKNLGTHIIAIPETAGIHIQGSNLIRYGTEPITIFQADKKISQ